MNNNKKIIYLFGEGRNKRIENLEDSSDEFFYGYNYIKNIYKDTENIEMNPHLKKPISNLVDKFLRKICHLPFFFSQIITFKNLKKILQCNVIIATNDRIGLSSLPLILVAKIFKKIKVLVIVMGLFSNTNKNKDNLLDKFFLYVFLRTVDQFLFLGKPETEKAKSLYRKFSHKFYFLPFCINTNFWKTKVTEEQKVKNNIAFIGNDGNRDFNKVLEISYLLPEINFIFVSQNFNSKNIPTNVELYKGSWGENTLTDLEIKKIYSRSKLTILPLKESIQPSGQSVTLQSISSGTPVMITKTEGFWDTSKYQNKKNILFIDNNSVENWVKEIKEIYNNDLLLHKIKQQGIELIEEEYNLNKFVKQLQQFL